MKTVELTDRELEILIDALGTHCTALGDSLAASGNPELADALTEVEDLETDMRELLHRDDGWGNDAIPSAALDVACSHDHRLHMNDAELDMVQAGIDAREQQKATSRAATRREEMLSGKVANDPIDW